MAHTESKNKDAGRRAPAAGEIGGTLGRPYGSYPSYGLTPERLTQIFREADAGDISRQAELFNEIEEKDAHLSSVLRTRALTVAGLEWEVLEASDSGEDAEVAAFVREALSSIEDLNEAFIGLLGAVSRGFSVAEIIWELSGARALVKGLRAVEQGHFTFAGRGAGGLGISRSPRLLTRAEPQWGEPLMPGKFVVHAAPGHAGSLNRGGLLRACSYMYLFKNYTLKDWVIFNERFAMPMRVGRFGAGTTESDRKVLKRAVYNLGTDAAAVISDSTVIELLESTNKTASADVYAKLVEFCDSAYSKAVLGQTLTTEQTQGTYATATVHQGVRQDLMEADAKALGGAITSQLVGPLVAYNFGPETKRPRLRFKYDPVEDLKALAETYAVLVRDVGLSSIPEAHLRERFAIPGQKEGGN